MYPLKPEARPILEGEGEPPVSTVRNGILLGEGDYISGLETVPAGASTISSISLRVVTSSLSFKNLFFVLSFRFYSLKWMFSSTD